MKLQNQNLIPSVSGSGRSRSAVVPHGRAAGNLILKRSITTGRSVDTFNSSASAIFALVWVALVLATGAASPVWAQNPVPPPGKPLPLAHGTSMQPVLGSLRPRGYLPVRINIVRAGVQAVTQRDTTYHVYSENWGYTYGSQTTSLKAHQVVMPRGATRFSEILIMQASAESFYRNEVIHLETDGNLRDTRSRNDIGQINCSNLFKQDLAARQVQVLFVSATRPASQITIQGDRFFATGDLAGETEADLLAEDNGENREQNGKDQPTAFLLKTLLGQSSLDRSSYYGGPVQVKPDPIEADATADRTDRGAINSSD